VAKKKKSDKADPSQTPEGTAAPAEADADLDPICETSLERFMTFGAILTVGLVAMLFLLVVNRVFDVPKAVALKVGGGGLLLVWLLVGLFGRGFAWTSVRVFLAPVIALAAAVTLSTLFSLDVATSVYGVYERQFGLQGFLGCVGLFIVTATCLRSKRGAVFGLACLAMFGGAIGTYALLQATGHDPYPFFPKPHNKVYAYLGNATFAGNALALIAPISTLVAIVAAVKTIRTGKADEDVGTSIVGVVLASTAVILALQIAPAWFAEGKAGVSEATQQSYFKFGVAASFALTLLFGALGSWGPKSMRMATASTRHMLDGAAAGALIAAAIGIGMGLLFTRTRGAWVGTTCAVVGGLVLLPGLFKRTRFYGAVRGACWGSLAFATIFMTTYVLKAESFCSDPKSRCMLIANTIRSIPAAFDPNRTDFGKGQGTRRYLWMESPRVLVDNADTLDRIFDDEAYAAQFAPAMEALDMDLDLPKAPSEEDRASEKTWRSILVWPFGIGIETYRYAFMSHKSKRLEALDPMTNHDNPHNNYLYVLASFGIVGLAAYLWVLYRLLTVSFSRFWRTPRRALVETGSGHEPDLVTKWTFEESADPPRLVLETADPKRIKASLEAANIDASFRIENDKLVVTKFDAKTSLDAIANAPIEGEPTIADRAIAFGVVTSFFSYSVYSIAGFDSVACSVFLYFLLGCAAVFFEPSVGERIRPIGVNIKRQWATFRGRDPDEVDNTSPIPLSVALALIGVLLLGPFPGGAIQGAKMTWDAEVAFVNARRASRDGIKAKLDALAEAVRIHPYESYYKQELGRSYAEAARAYVRQSMALARKGKNEEARAFRQQGETFARNATAILYAALDHAWAPENIFITAFQMHYAIGEVQQAEAALERALVHSPHLGAVRGNLAVLKVERGAFEEAKKDAEWVLEVDPRSAIAHRVMGQYYTEKKDWKKAKAHLDKAKRYGRGDRAIDRAIQLYEQAKKAAETSTTG
jgi:Flp pilus assembly protein TadD